MAKTSLVEDIIYQLERLNEMLQCGEWDQLQREYKILGLLEDAYLASKASIVVTIPKEIYDRIADQ